MSVNSVHSPEHEDVSLFSREPRLYKRVCPSVGPSVGPLVRRSVGPSVGNAFVSAGRDEPANDLFRVYELVIIIMHLFLSTQIF